MPVDGTEPRRGGEGIDPTSVTPHHVQVDMGQFLGGCQRNFIYYFPLFALGLIEKILCVGCGNKPLTAAGLIDLFVVDCHGESGSNARLQSEEATMFMECFIVDFVVDCHRESESNARLQSEEATMFMECFIVEFVVDCHRENGSKARL